MHNSSDKSDYRRSRKFALIYNPGNVHTRISATPYFNHEHDEIPTHLVTGNKEVNSFSNGNTCHRKAEQASFRERDIFISGYWRWDDSLLLGYTCSMKQLTALLSRVLLIVFLLAHGNTVQADGDHDDATRLRKSGDILSLELVQEKLRQSHPGKILEVALITKSGKMVYDIEILSDDGIVRVLIVDARNGDLLRSERND